MNDTKDNAAPDAAKKPDLKKLGKKAASTAAGAGLAASLLVGSVFPSADDILDDEASVQPAAIVQTIDLSSAYPGPAPAEDETETEAKRSFGDKVRAFLLRMPVAARAVVLVPLWAVGWGLIHAVGLLGSLIGLPVVGAILKFLLGAAIVLALIIGAMKLLFPEVPVKELLGKRNLWGLLACVCVIGAAGACSSLLWPGKPWVTPLVDVSAAALYLGYFLLFVKKRKQTA